MSTPRHVSLSAVSHSVSLSSQSEQKTHTPTPLTPEFFQEWETLTATLRQIRESSSKCVNSKASKDTATAPPPPVLQRFRDAINTATQEALEKKPYIHSLSQFQCAMDALQSVSCSYTPFSDITHQTQAAKCVFSGETQKENLFFIQFIRFVDRAPTIAHLHPLVTTTPWYCVGRPFLFLLLGFHFLGRVETLLYSATTPEEESKIIDKFEYCMKFTLQTFPKHYVSL